MNKVSGSLGERTMRTLQVLAIRKEYKNQVSEKYGLLEIGVFGSFARNEES